MSLSSNSILNSGGKKFGDPFMLPSTESFPKDIRGTLDLCLYLYGLNRSYGAATNRIATYFITDIEFEGESNKEERDSLKELLLTTIGVFTKMQRAGMEWAIYGNAFIRCVEPFDRWLVVKRDGEFHGVIALSSFPEHMVQYNWDRLTYTVPDLEKIRAIPREQRKKGALPTVELEFKDKPSSAPDRFSIVFLDPRYVTLDKAHHSDSIQYVYTIPPSMETRIKEGNLHEVNHTPRKLLEAVKENKDYRFHKGEIFHFHGPDVCGISDSGWICPEILWHYHSLYQLQIYRKADYAIAQDKLVPMKVFTPSFGDQVGESLLTMMMSQWKGEMQRMIAAHRKDPTVTHALPFKADYNEYGGATQTMTLHDVVQVHTEAFFDGLGIPQELFRGTMMLEQAPIAIQMFEKSYEWMYQMMSGLLRFISSTVQKAMDADEIKLHLKRPSMAYNAEVMQLKLQLAANRELPREDVYPDLGITDPAMAAVRAAVEDQDIQRNLNEINAKFEKEKTQGSMADVAIMAAEQGAATGGGGAPAGGAPAAGAPGGTPDYAVDPGADPLMIDQRAQEVADQWLQMHATQPNSHRKEMQKCEATNPTLYASAKQAMEKKRSAGASQGRASVGQQPPQ